jgi:Hemerythrin HHE cation binding domain
LLEVREEYFIRVIRDIRVIRVHAFCWFVTVVTADPGGKRMDLKIPPSLKHEHGELRASLEIATKAAGKSGDAAREVSRLMEPHFRKEEEYALPPLDALAVLAGGGLPESPKAIIDKTDRLRVELAGMLKEHEIIAKAVEHLYETATVDARPELARFARKLLLHAQMEEQIYYPAALVVGDHLKLRTGKG